MEKFKIYSIWTSAKAEMLGLDIHLYTNGFAGATEKTAELLGAKAASAVSVPVPPSTGHRGSAMTVGVQGCL